MKLVLITGITGQDGAYLSQSLLKKGYKVLGFVRPDDDFSKLEYLGIKEKIIFEECDLLDIEEVKKNIKKYNPAEIYNFAAQSSVKDSLKIPVETLNFNILSVVHLLEAIRTINKKLNFFRRPAVRCLVI